MEVFRKDTILSELETGKFLEEVMSKLRIVKMTKNQSKRFCRLEGCEKKLIALGMPRSGRALLL